MTRIEMTRPHVIVWEAMRDLMGVDTIVIQGQSFILVHVGAGAAVHLAASDGGDKHESPPVALCGRQWTHQASGEAVPTCRRCLGLLDRLFPSPPRDPRIDLIANLVVDALTEHGVAEVVDVPGDQMPELRRTVRRAIRARLGYRSNTHVMGGRLVISCEEAYAPHAAQLRRQAADRMAAMLTGENVPAVDDSDRRLRWSNWATP